MQNSYTYRLVVRVSALLILFGVLLPAGLQAKALADYCFAPVEQSDGMLPDHSCCESQENEPDKNPTAKHHTHCDWGIICACDISMNNLSDQVWIVKIYDATVELDELDHSTLFISTNELIDNKFQKKISEYDPPLWLLYDTLLL